MNYILSPEGKVWPNSELTKSEVSMNSIIIPSGKSPLEISKGFSKIKCRSIELLLNESISTEKAYSIGSVTESMFPEMRENLRYLERSTTFFLFSK